MAATLYEDALDVPAPIRLNESVTAMLRCWYRANDMFIPRGKELISTIAFLD